jgi:hypothetical protein
MDHVIKENTMIFVLRLFKDGAICQKPTKTIKFTWWTCKGNPIDYADRKAIYAGNFRSMELLQQHFQGRQANADYGYGKGLEPIMVGSV